MNFTERRFTAEDGTPLYARDYSPEKSALTPVVCLPGLTRNSKDFETIAPRLARSRRVICPDFRGRGLSGRADPSTYRPDQECADTLLLLDQLGVVRFGIIGTSRGGIVAMVMAARALPRMAGVVFNDIGPRIDKAGLLRIRSYLGADASFAHWGDAVEAMKFTTPGFETLSDAEWLSFARAVFRDADGKPHTDYDPGLTANFPSAADIEAGKVPELWALLELMADLPCVVFRGEHSDLLSAQTVDEMVARHRDMTAVTVKDRGHVPFLNEPDCSAAIDQWLKRIDTV